MRAHGLVPDLLLRNSHSQTLTLPPDPVTASTSSDGLIRAVDGTAPAARQVGDLRKTETT